MKWGQLCLVSKGNVKTHIIYNSEFVLTIQNEGVNVWEIYNDDDSYLNTRPCLVLGYYIPLWECVVSLVGWDLEL